MLEVNYKNTKTNKQKPDMVVRVHNPKTQEAEAGETGLNQADDKVSPQLARNYIGTHASKRRKMNCKLRI